MEKRYQITEVGPWEQLSASEYKGLRGKRFVGKELGLTGCEVSLNRAAAGSAMPFVHSHQKNEELYIVLRGRGVFFVDGEEFPVREGSLIRVDPAAERSWKAGDEDLDFICIQAEAGSLTQATLADGRRHATKTSWMGE